MDSQVKRSGIMNIFVYRLAALCSERRINIIWFLKKKGRNLGCVPEVHDEYYKVKDVDLSVFVEVGRWVPVWV